MQAFYEYDSQVVVMETKYYHSKNYDFSAYQTDFIVVPVKHDYNSNCKIIYTKIIEIVFP